MPAGFLAQVDTIATHLRQSNTNAITRDPPAPGLAAVPIV
jgi:hypothetical protein